MGIEGLDALKDREPPCPKCNGLGKVYNGPKIHWDSCPMCTPKDK